MKNFDEKAIISRICQLRSQYAGERGKSKFAHDLGVSASTYNYYEHSRVPPIALLLKICELTSSDLEWLLTGKIGEQNSLAGPNKAILEKVDELLRKNPQLTMPVSAFISLLAEKQGFESQIQAKPSAAAAESPGWIPVLGRTAAGMVHFWSEQILPESQQAVTELDELVKKHCGKDIVASANGVVSIDMQARALVDGLSRPEANLVQVSSDEEAEGIVEFLECKELFELFPDSFALRIDGDSMSPRINDGDVVVLSPSVPAVQGHIAVIRVTNQIGVTCKLMRTTEEKVHLIPINERYETKVVASEQLAWALAVLCHVSV